MASPKPGTLRHLSDRAASSGKLDNTLIFKLEQQVNAVTGNIDLDLSTVEGICLSIYERFVNKFVDAATQAGCRQYYSFCKL